MPLKLRGYIGSGFALYLEGLIMMTNQRLKVLEKNLIDRQARGFPLRVSMFNGVTLSSLKPCYAKLKVGNSSRYSVNKHTGN